MSATEIVRLSVETLDIPLVRPFGISGGAQAVANNLLVTVELADGTLGFGEAAPLPPFNGETQASSATALVEIERWVGAAPPVRAFVPPELAAGVA